MAFSASCSRHRPEMSRNAISLKRRATVTFELMKRIAVWAFYALGAVAIALSRALRLCGFHRTRPAAGRSDPYLSQARRAGLFAAADAESG